MNGKRRRIAAPPLRFVLRLTYERTPSVFRSDSTFAVYSLSRYFLNVFFEYVCSRVSHGILSTAVATKVVATSCNWFHVLFIVIVVHQTNLSHFRLPVTHGGRWWHVQYLFIRRMVVSSGWPQNGLALSNIALRSM